MGIVINTIKRIFRRRKRKKETDTAKLDEPLYPRPKIQPRVTPSQPPLPEARPAPLTFQQPSPMQSASGDLKPQVDLVMSQMQTLRMQYDAINARLQNIERVVTEIRSFHR